jgi:hypothetical protein
VIIIFLLGMNPQIMVHLLITQPLPVQATKKVKITFLLVEFHYYWLFFDLYTYVTVDKKNIFGNRGVPS